MRKSLFFAAALLALAACTREVAVDVPEGDITLVARTEAPAGSRTIVEGETHVYWESGDEIKVFVGTESGKFTTDITDSAATATFNGSLDVSAGVAGIVGYSGGSLIDALLARAKKEIETREQ